MDYMRYEFLLLGFAGLRRRRRVRIRSLSMLSGNPRRASGNLSGVHLDAESLRYDPLLGNSSEMLSLPLQIALGAPTNWFLLVVIAAVAAAAAGFYYLQVYRHRVRPVAV
jgi:hypothetical protein